MADENKKPPEFVGMERSDEPIPADAFQIIGVYLRPTGQKQTEMRIRFDPSWYAPENKEQALDMITSLRDSLDGEEIRLRTGREMTAAERNAALTSKH
jgi:hypothetical protein